MFLQKTLKFDCNLLVEKIVLTNYFNGMALHLNTLHCSLVAYISMNLSIETFSDCVENILTL